MNNTYNEMSILNSTLNFPHGIRQNPGRNMAGVSIFRSGNNFSNNIYPNTFFNLEHGEGPHFNVKPQAIPATQVHKTGLNQYITANTNPTMNIGLPYRPNNKLAEINNLNQKKFNDNTNPNKKSQDFYIGKDSMSDSYNQLDIQSTRLNINEQKRKNSDEREANRISSMKPNQLSNLKISTNQLEDQQNKKSSPTKYNISSPLHNQTVTRKRSSERIIDANSLVKSPRGSINLPPSPNENMQKMKISNLLDENAGKDLLVSGRKHSLTNLSRGSRKQSFDNNKELFEDNDHSRGVGRLEIKFSTRTLDKEDGHGGDSLMNKRKASDVLKDAEDSDEDDLFNSDSEDEPDKEKKNLENEKNERKKIKIEAKSSSEKNPETQVKKEEEYLTDSKKPELGYQEKMRNILNTEENLESGPKNTDLEGEEEKGSPEDELNSDDDISDEEIVDTGKNILLAYYEKNVRKRDRRKIHFKHCILRINDVEYILPSAKGDFEWIGSTKGRAAHNASNNNNN